MRRSAECHLTRHGGSAEATRTGLDPTNSILRNRTVNGQVPILNSPGSGTARIDGRPIPRAVPSVGEIYTASALAKNFQAAKKPSCHAGNGSSGHGQASSSTGIQASGHSALSRVSPSPSATNLMTAGLMHAAAPVLPDIRGGGGAGWHIHPDGSGAAVVTGESRPHGHAHHAPHIRHSVQDGGPSGLTAQRMSYVHSSRVERASHVNVHLGAAARHSVGKDPRPAARGAHREARAPRILEAATSSAGYDPEPATPVLLYGRPGAKADSETKSEPNAKDEAAAAAAGAAAAGPDLRQTRLSKSLPASAGSGGSMGGDGVDRKQKAKTWTGAGGGADGSGRLPPVRRGFVGLLRRCFAPPSVHVDG